MSVILSTLGATSLFPRTCNWCESEIPAGEPHVEVGGFHYAYKLPQYFHKGCYNQDNPWQLFGVERHVGDQLSREFRARRDRSTPQSR